MVVCVENILDFLFLNHGPISIQNWKMLCDRIQDESASELHCNITVGGSCELVWSVVNFQSVFFGIL